ncbi:MAG: hypothetical protein KDC44_23470, partial [Phaeodactylibacter sp.]|nr:hypothetical protein [Phaeodactylibacter sp.]
LEQFNPNEYGHEGQLSTNLDLWSFGVILTEMMNGRPVFGRRDNRTTLEQIMNTILKSPLPPPPVLRMKKPYSDMLRKCLVRQAGDRVQSAGDLLALLEPHLQWPRPTGTFQPKLSPPQPIIEPAPTTTEQLEPRRPKIVIRPARLVQSEVGSDSDPAQPAATDRPVRPKIIIPAHPKEKAPKRPAGSNTKMLLLILLLLLLLGAAGFIGSKFWLN